MVQTSIDANSKIKLTNFGEDVSFPFSFFIYRDLLDELVFSASYSLEETFAILLGEIIFNDTLNTTHDKIGRVDITGFDSFQNVKLDAAYPSIRDAIRAIVTQELKNQEIEKKNIPTFHMPSLRRTEGGLFFSLPGCGARPTPQMMRLHLSLFSLAHLPMIVFDPIEKKIALYARKSLQFINIPFTLVTRQP